METETLADLFPEPATEPPRQPWAPRTLVLTDAGRAAVRAYRVTQAGQRIDASDLEWIELPAWVIARLGRQS